MKIYSLLGELSHKELASITSSLLVNVFEGDMADIQEFVAEIKKMEK